MGQAGQLVSNALLAASGVGLLLLVLHLVTLARHLRGATPAPPAARPGVSILKPLCGLDDELEQNLATFAALPYPDYEVLLGVRGPADAAYPLALAAARRWPGRFRVVLQQGEPGLNPKVNQLVTLARAARHDLIVISDSNTRVPPGYLDEIAAWMADPAVGLVTHPLAGAGDDRPGGRLGSRLDNLHLTGSVSPGLVAAKRLCHKDYVVGKSMAMRRRDVEALGGFQAVKDVLAEDFVLGRLVPEKLGKRVVLGRAVVTCFSVRRSTPAFVRRYARWSVMQRQCAGLPAYLGMLLLNPLLLATLALALAPSPFALAAWGVVAAARAALAAGTGSLLRGRGHGFGLRAALWTPLADLLAAAAWAHGLTSRSIEWRSNRLTVLRGSALRVRPPRRRFRARRLAPAGSGKGPATAAA